MASLIDEAAAELVNGQVIPNQGKLSLALYVVGIGLAFVMPMGVDRDVPSRCSDLVRP